MRIMQFFPAAVVIAAATTLQAKPLTVGIVDRCKGDLAASEMTFVNNVIENGGVAFVIPRTTSTNAVDALLE